MIHAAQMITHAASTISLPNVTVTLPSGLDSVVNNLLNGLAALIGKVLPS
jgi:hypothetical protein